MIRYHCPHCTALIIAHERRIGQSSVCKTCVTPHQNPADKSLWLNELGEPLHPPAPADALTPEPAEPGGLEPTTPAMELHPESVQLMNEPEQLAPTLPDIQLPESFPAPHPLAAMTPPPAHNPEPSMPAARVSSPATSESIETRGLSPAPSEQPSPQFASAAVATLTPPPARPRTQPPTVATPAPRATSARRANPVRGATPAPVPPPSPEPEYSEPVQLQTQADIAVALTAALTSRMKPPPTPRRDLRPSTALWMLSTGIGLALFLLALFSDANYSVGVLLIGVVQQVAGYIWIVRLTGLRDVQRGLLCAIPPLTFVYMTQYKYAKLRPLRFYATGVLFVVLAWQSQALAPHTQALLKPGGDSPRTTPADPATMSKLEQLRYYRERQAYNSLTNLLELLAKTDPLLSEDAKDRTELATELRSLCQHTDTNVKVQAMAAYARWDPDNARAICLSAIRSGNYQEREKALQLLPQWKDAECARAVQSLIGRPGTVETNRAKAALEEIGGPPAEEAALALLNRVEDQATKLTALSILEKVGGADTAARLRTLALTADPAVSEKALAVADAIDARLRLIPAP